MSFIAQPVSQVFSSSPKLASFPRTIKIDPIPPPKRGSEVCQHPDQLAGIEGKFILSLNDTPEVRDLFSRFKIDAVETSYSINDKGRGKRAKEVIISNEA